MMKLKKLNQILAILMICHLMQPLSLLANIPTAYLACEGANVGDRCSLPGPEYGTCTRDTLCEDPPDTKINECVLCVDDCWSLANADPCTRRFTGTPGICQIQMQCTDKIETSFKECQRCVQESLMNDNEVDDQEASCQSLKINDVWGGMLFLVGILMKRRRN
jgi:hypothetical protein